MRLIANGRCLEYKKLVQVGHLKFKMSIRNTNEHVE